MVLLWKAAKGALEKLFAGRADEGVGLPRCHFSIEYFVLVTMQNEVAA